MHSFLVDLRHSFRILTRRPTFTIVALITLALGIGATTGVFSAFHAVLLASMPYPEADRLVMGRRTQDGNVGSWVSMLDYLDYRDQTTSFASLAADRVGPNRLPSTGGDRPERLNVQTVSFNLFSTLGVSPVLGRAFMAEEGSPEPALAAGAPPQIRLPPVAIISFGTWHKRFAGSQEVIGRTLTLMGQSVTVVGVMPEGFSFRGAADVWLPMQLGPREARRFHNWLLVGRLKPGVTITQAQAEIDAISGRLAQLYPDSNKGKGLHLDTLHEALIETLRPQVLLIMAAVALMLLIACGNVANLLLARGVTRRSEMAMRFTLGATRARVVRQLVTESVVLALAGGAAGLVVAAALQRALPTLLGLDALAITSLKIDLGLLSFAVAVSLITGVLVGLVPALRSTRVSLFEELKGATRTATSRTGSGFRMALVAAQVTLSLVLLVGSSLLVRSFAKLVRTDLGFDPDNLLTATFLLPPQAYASDLSRIQFYRALLADIRSIPGVTAAGMVDRLPIQGPGGDIGVWTPDKWPKESSRGQTALTRRVLPGYFAAMGMPLVGGRDIQETDRMGTPSVLVINQTMARTLFANESPLGGKVVVDWPASDQPITFEVVGVVADARVNRVRSTPYLTMYHSFTQFPSSGFSVAIRSSADPQGLTRALRDVVGRRDKDIPIEELATMKSAIRSSTLAQQTLAGIVTSFSLLALLLAAVGLFGVLTYQVNQRQHELGIRMALGARGTHVLSTVLGQGLAMTGAGVAAGVVVGLALTRLMSGLLYEVAPSDPASFLAAVLGLLVVALIACLAPAARALRIQPIRALRYE